MPAVFDWLRRATAATLAAPSSQTDAAFQRALLDVAQRVRMPRNIRTAAEDALQRLERAEWKPRHVLMHGDLWLGNILSGAPPGLVQIATRKYVVIDSPGGQVRGYPIYDLSRLCTSIGQLGAALSERAIGARAHPRLPAAGCGGKPAECTRSHRSAARGLLSRRTLHRHGSTVRAQRARRARPELARRLGIRVDSTWLWASG